MPASENVKWDNLSDKVSTLKHFINAGERLMIRRYIFFKDSPEFSVYVKSWFPWRYPKASEKPSSSSTYNSNKHHRDQVMLEMSVSGEKKNLYLYIWSFPPTLSMKGNNSGNNEFPLQHMGWEFAVPTGNWGPKTVISKTKIMLLLAKRQKCIFFTFPMGEELNGFKFKQRPNIYISSPTCSHPQCLKQNQACLVFLKLAYMSSSGLVHPFLTQFLKHVFEVAPSRFNWFPCHSQFPEPFTTDHLSPQFPETQSEAEKHHHQLQKSKRLSHS